MEGVGRRERGNQQRRKEVEEEEEGEAQPEVEVEEEEEEDLKQEENVLEEEEEIGVLWVNPSHINTIHIVQGCTHMHVGTHTHTHTCTPTHLHTDLYTNLRAHAFTGPNLANEIRSTLVVHVEQWTRGAGLRVQPDLSRYAVASVMRTGRRLCTS